MGEEEGELDSLGPALPPPLIFEFNEGPKKTLASLGTMRKQRRFCDVILQVGKAEVHAHRAVLASASPYLYELFSTEEQTVPVPLTFRLDGKFDREALEKLVEYTYTSRLEAPPEQVRSIYLAANRLKLESAANACADYLLAHIDFTNCLAIRSLPGLSKRKELVKSIDVFIQQEMGQVARSEQLQSLPRLQAEVLHNSREERREMSPVAVCRLLIEWIKSKWEEGMDNVENMGHRSYLFHFTRDNLLQDCCELHNGQLSDTELVQDYKRMTKRLTHTSTPKPRQQQPKKPRALLYSRRISEQQAAGDGEADENWKLIACSSVAEHSVVAIASVGGKVVSLAVQQRISPAPESLLTPEPSSEYTSSNGSETGGSGDGIANLSDLDNEEGPPLPARAPLKAMAHMSTAKCAMGCVILEHMPCFEQSPCIILVCGGYDRGECLKTCEIYIPGTNSWVIQPQMKEARGRVGAAVINGMVFAVGGSNGTTELASVEKWVPGESAWHRVAPMPLARSHAGVCALEGRVCCVGGWCEQSGTKKCHAYDPNLDTWVELPPLAVGRFQCGVAPLPDGRLMALGGGDSWTCLSSVEALDLRSPSWYYLPELPSVRRGVGAAFFDNHLWAVGGSDGQHSLCVCDVFDPRANRWDTAPSLSTCRANPGLASLNGKLYAIGGFSGKAFLPSMESVGPSGEWSPFIDVEILTTM